MAEYRKNNSPKDDYQKTLIQNLVYANREATMNFQTLLRTIGSAGEESNATSELSIRQVKMSSRTGAVLQDHARSLDDGISPLELRETSDLARTDRDPGHIAALASPPTVLEDSTVISPKSTAEIVLAAETT